MSGSVPAPRPFVILSQIFIFVGANDFARSCASVLTATNCTQFIPSAIILLTALLPAHPTPITIILAPAIKSGLNSVRVMIKMLDYELKIVVSCIVVIYVC
jgi:hypothetical protein